MSRRIGTAVAAVVLVASAIRSQEPDPVGPQQLYRLDWAFQSSGPEGDFWETYAFGGFRFQWPALGLEIRGQNALLLSDREAISGRIEHLGGEGGPPRRGIDPPDPRRTLTPEVMRQRVTRLLSALGRADAGEDRPGPVYDVPRFLYFEGGVLVFRHGVEVARCDRLWISPQDDRMVVEGAELRYPSAGLRDQVITVRGPKLVKQGPRWTGRDLSVTTCDAGEPHVAVHSGELELIEREGQFEIRSRGNSLQIGGASLSPLPDAHFFSAEQTSLPIRGVRTGYSGKEGVRLGVELGMPIQEAGGSIHNWLLGRPAHEFRGDWELDVGWIEKRGFPLEGALNYGAAGLYRGRTDGFYMDDDGPNRREILTNLDGSVIDDRNRNMVRTENRVILGDDTHLDLSAFHAGDAAVYSEFFGGDYRNRKLPETSIYLHHGDGNVLFTVNGRFQTSDFSYQDNRALAPFFVEELPVATLQLVSQPVAELPWGTPLVVDTATEVGQRRRAIDDRAPPGFSPDRTTRVDQTVELSAPLHLGPLQLRPFAAGNVTWYDETVDGTSDTRLAFAAGIRAATRMSRTWSWLDADGREQRLRHVISPIITFSDRFHVEGDPGDYNQYDALDALTERNLVRFEVRNLLQRMEDKSSGRTDGDGGEKGEQDTVPVVRNIVFLDLSQDVFPDAARDNNGQTAGLFSYDLRLRSAPAWWPLDTLYFGLWGDHDWDEGLRTLDTELGIGRVLGVDWTLDYRTDEVVDGAVGLGGHTALLGRWDAYGNVSYDFDRDEVLNYYVGLVRDDHDWALMVGIDYDPFSDEITFRMEMEPRLFGGRTPRPRSWLGEATAGNSSWNAY